MPALTVSMPIRSLTFLLPLLILAACTGPAEVTDDPSPPAPPVTEAGFPAYETFDPSPYVVEPPPPAPGAAVVEHDVPADLMAGLIVEEPDAYDGRVLEGFRIQIFTSEAKSAADAVRDDVVAWYQRSRYDEEVDEAFEFGLHPVVVFGSPFYRVRVGLFLDRDHAAEALAILRDRYPEAFLVPDTITITRD